MRLKDAFKIREVLTKSLPFCDVRLSVGNSICDNVEIRLSLDRKETWANGIFQNSRWAILHIFPAGQREQLYDIYHLDFSNHTGVPLRKINRAPIEKIVSYLEKKFGGTK